MDTTPIHFAAIDAAFASRQERPPISDDDLARRLDELAARERATAETDDQEDA